MLTSAFNCFPVLVRVKAPVFLSKVTYLALAASANSNVGATNPNMPNGAAPHLSPAFTSLPASHIFSLLEAFHIAPVAS